MSAPRRMIVGVSGATGIAYVVRLPEIFHAGHLKAMLAATEAGAVVFPPVPAFYAKPASLADMVDHTGRPGARPARPRRRTGRSLDRREALRSRRCHSAGEGQAMTHYKDLRSFLDALAAVGELTRIAAPVALDLEIGAVSRHAGETGAAAPRFETYPPGIRERAPSRWAEYGYAIPEQVA